MNRTSRRSAAETAEALLEVGRTQPALDYDIEVGLARHHHWLRSEAPIPEWESTSASVNTATAAKSLVPIVIKTIVSAVLLGSLGLAAWHARSRPQLPAAAVNASSSGAERTQPALPSVANVHADEDWRARTPMPVPNPSQTSERPARQSPRRFQRAHKEPAVAPSEEKTRARVDAAAPATTSPSEQASVERATRDEVAAAPERKPSGEVHGARPEPAPKAQVPDNLVEMQQVATAEQLLARAPGQALALVRQGDQRFAHGYFQQERAYITIMALIRLGRVEEARTRAARFAKQFPALPYGARIRGALEAGAPAAPAAASRRAVPE